MSSSAFIFSKSRKNWDDLFRLGNQYFKFWFLHPTNQPTNQSRYSQCIVLSYLPIYLCLDRKKKRTDYIILLLNYIALSTDILLCFTSFPYFFSHNYALFILNVCLCSSNLCQPCMSCLFSGDNPFLSPFLTQTPNICSENTIGLHWVKQRKWLSHYYKEKKSSFLTYISDEEIKICQ